MIESLKKFFAGPEPGDKAGGDPKRDIMVATCAIMLEMANIDDEFTRDEQNEIVSVLKSRFRLADEVAVKLMDSARAELENSVDLWSFTSMINKNYSREERIGIMRTIWEIVYTDGKLDKHEDYLAHKLSNLLRLSHKELIDAKLSVISRSKAPDK